MIPRVLESLIASATTLVGVLVGWWLERISANSDRRRRATGRLARVRAELRRNAANLEVFPSAPAGTVSHLEDAAHAAHQDSLSELVDDEIMTTVEEAYSEIETANAELAKRSLSPAQAAETLRRINEALRRLEPRRAWWRSRRQ